MMDQTPRTPESASAGPERPNDAVVDVDEGKSDIIINPSGAGENFVAAFRVSREHDGSVMLSAPTTLDGAVLRIVVGPGILDDPALAAVPRLPIKDLANPGVALVVRSSFERLVRAAREMVEHDTGETPESDDAARELGKSLEPFKEVANSD